MVTERIAIVIGIIFIIIASGVIFVQLKARNQVVTNSVNFDYRQSALVGDTVIFTNTSEDQSADDWIWDFGDNSTKLQSRDGFHVYEVGGRFTVTLTYNGEEKQTRKQIIVINTPDPVAVFDLPKDTVKVGEEVSPMNRSSNASEIVWTFDNRGSTSDENSPTFVYNNPGNYNIRLIVANMVGQVDEADQEIVVVGKPIAAVIEDNHIPIFDENSLSEALTSIANRGISRVEKRQIKNQVIRDSESLRIEVEGMTLENYLNKLQLEASSQRKEIRVTTITRNNSKRIESFSVEN